MLLSLFRVSGHSMEPVIQDGQTLLVSSIPFLFEKPKIDDVVLFEVLNKKFVKRIMRIEKENYYLTGDNKKDSLDSRKLGWIKKEEMLGKVLFVK